MREFDGAPAKGEPIKITYDFSFRPKAKVTGAAHELLSRIADGERQTRSRPGVPTGPRQGSHSYAPAAPRTVGGGRGGDRRGRGGGRDGGRRGERGPPKSAVDLDAELDAFMKEEPAGGAGTNDVEMV